MVAHSARLSAAFLGLAAAFACGPAALPADKTGSASGSLAPHPTRIVSLVPAVTEMLFAIGAGPRVIAVSSFDTYPPEVLSLTRVGALIDPDIERILSLKPDLVIVYGTQDELKHQLARASIRQFDYVHGGLADVSSTIEALGQLTGLQENASAVLSGIARDIESIRHRVSGLRRPQAILVFGRQLGSLRAIYASGGKGFLADMLAVAGGANVFGDVDRESIQATTELILARAPEIVVELRAGKAFAREAVEQERHVWSRLTAVPAVQNQRVVFLFGDEMVVPGPRVGAAIARLARVIHPEAF